MTAQTTSRAVRTRFVSPPNGRAGGALAIAFIAAAVSLMTVICVSGKSAAVADVGPGTLPLHFDAGLSDRFVTVLCWAAVIVGALSSGAGLLALSRGWRPRPRTLLIWSAVAVTVLTVVSVAGSTDVLDYAVYGRIASLGHDPYRLTPGWLVRIGDPVGHYAPISWRHTPSLYGPLAIGLFSLASTIGGTSMAATVFILKLVAGAAFLATGFGLDRLAGPDPVARARVHLLWTLNPVMLWGMVAGAHVDAIAAALIVGAILALRWSTRSAGTNAALTSATATGAGATGGGATSADAGATRADASRGGAPSRGVLGDAVARTAMRATLTGLLAGTLLGAATAIKLPYVLAGIGLIWMVRRSPVTILCGAVATAIVTGGGYLIAGRTSITALTRNAGGRSEIDPWNLLDRHFHFLKPLTTSAGALAILAFVVLTALVWWSLAGPGPAASNSLAATSGRPGIAGALRAARGQGWAQILGATPNTGDRFVTDATPSTYGRFGTDATPATTGRLGTDATPATTGRLGTDATSGMGARSGSGGQLGAGGRLGTGEVSDRGEPRGVGGGSWTVALVPAFAIALGWLATSPYQHPWYDAMLFPLLALLPRTRLDGLIVARGAVAWIGYIPGDPSRLSPPWFNHMVKGTLMSRVVPFALDLVIFGICLACLPVTLHLAKRFARRLRL